MSILENDIIKLRALEMSDIDLIYNWENDSSNWNVSNTIVPFSRYILLKYLKSSYKDIYETKQLRLMIDLKSKNNTYKTIGAIDLFDFDAYNLRGGVGILIAKEDDRHKGYAREALKILINYSFQTLKLHQLYCNITNDNISSMNLFKNLGFEVIGNKKDWAKTSNGWIDEYMLQLINDK